MVTASNKNNDRDEKKNRGSSPSNGHLEDVDKDGGKYKTLFLICLLIMIINLIDIFSEL